MDGSKALNGDTAEALLGGSGARPAGRSRLFGYVCIFFLVITWISQSEVAQAVETTSYNRPYIITWINHCLGLLMCLVSMGGSARISPFKFLQGGKMMWQVLAICIIYQLADWVWYIGLTGTSVADGTIIFNTMSVFVFLIELCLGRRKLNMRSAFAIAISLVGVVVVQKTPGRNNAAPDGGCMSQLGGNLLVLAAAILYAVYQIAVDEVVPGSDMGLTNAFVSASGLITLTMLWPAALALTMAPKSGCLYEPLDLPPPEAAAGLALTGFLALAFNVFFCLCIVYTSPLETAVGCMLTVPTGLLTDLLLHGDPIQPSAICGSTLVVVGFLVIAVQSQSSDKGR